MGNGPTWMIAMRTAVPRKPTGKELRAMIAGPAMNLKAIARMANLTPQAITLFCIAMNIPAK